MTYSLSQFTVSIADSAILPLVKRFFHSQGMRAQAAKNDIVVVLRDTSANNKIIGALRLCAIEHSWLLRSMSIDQNYQRQGLGRYLLQQIEDILQDKVCYCFPYPHLDGFYQLAGFKTIEANQANAEISALYEQYTNSGKRIIIMQFRQDVTYRSAP